MNIHMYFFYKQFNKSLKYQNIIFVLPKNNVSIDYGATAFWSIYFIILWYLCNY